jgi:hypothetical protein
VPVLPAMVRVVVVLGLGLLLWSPVAHAAGVRWRQLQPGVAYARLPVKPPAGIQIADKNLYLVRIEPKRARLRLLMASALDRKQRTAAEWARAHRLAAVINLGMYHPNHVTHVGYLRVGEHVNSRRWVPGYGSILAVGPRTPGHPAALLLDRDREKMDQVLARYDGVVQNLRLIRARGEQGEGVWSRQTRRWSEAALAMDDRGRLLMVFTRVPLSMWELNQLLLGLPLGIVRATHLEGGPEASLSIHAGGLRLDLCGSFESGFLPADSNNEQWPLPNVLGVERR